MISGYPGYGGYPSQNCAYSPWGNVSNPWFNYAPGWSISPWGLGGLRTWGGTYSPQFIAAGIPTDEEIEEMIYDAIDADPMVPYDAEIEIDVDAGEVTLSGTVPNKRVKYAVGDDAWWAPGVVDVNNNIQVSSRRRSRYAPKEQETPTQTATRTSAQSRQTK